jgi:hypothetical protein
MSVRKGQARLRGIAKVISSEGQLSDEDGAFLVTALRTIADGGDADTALGVKAKKGERKSHYARNTEFSKQLFFGWLMTAMAPEDEDPHESGLGLSLKDAVAKGSPGWPNLPSEESLRRQWNDVRKQQKRNFKIKTD